MTREEWLNFKNTGQLNIFWLFEFYNSQVENQIMFKEFQEKFNIYQNYGGNLNKFISHFDDLFNVNILKNKNDEIIKYL